jgi:hypothetical protein
MIPFDILTELVGIATETWGLHSWYRVAPPTAQSIQRIQRELGITIPDDYLRIAAACSSYGGWLAGIGDDYDHGCHILRLNSAFHSHSDSPALPPHFVLLNHGHDGDCDCWDTREVTSSGEHPIVYVGLDGMRPCCVERFESFGAYIENFALQGAPKNPKTGRRRRAKRLIQQLQHDDHSG